MEIDTLSNYQIFQGITDYPIAGFVLESDARNFLGWVREVWPDTEFRMVSYMD